MKDFDKKLRVTGLIFILTPILFGQLFHLLQLFEQTQSDYLCTLTDSDYLTYLAIESGRNNMSSYIPFAIWNMLTMVFIQISASVILLYEIHVIIVNEKAKIKNTVAKNSKKAFFSLTRIRVPFFTKKPKVDEESTPVITKDVAEESDVKHNTGIVKQSLVKHHKKALFNFFAMLVLILTLSEYYVSVKKPQALTQVNFMGKVITGRQDFFIACSGASDVILGDESKLIQKQKEKP